MNNCYFSEMDITYVRLYKYIYTAYFNTYKFIAQCKAWISTNHSLKNFKVIQYEYTKQLCINECQSNQSISQIQAVCAQLPRELVSLEYACRVAEMIKGRLLPWLNHPRLGSWKQCRWGASGPRCQRRQTSRVLQRGSSRYRRAPHEASFPYGPRQALRLRAVLVVERI